VSSIITAKLYGAAPVLICSVDEPCPLISLLGATGLDLLFYDADARSFQEGDQQLSLSRLYAPPSCLCVLFATMAETEKQMEELRTWWAKQEAGVAPETVRLLPPDGAVGTQSLFSLPGVALVRRLVAGLSEETARISESYAKLLRQTIELRAELEDLRAKSPLGDLGQGLRLGVTCGPSDSLLFRGPASGENRMSFTFPCQVRGLSRLDLHFSDLGATGTLTVLLHGFDPGEALAGWRIDYGALVDGWQEFKLLQPLLLRDQRISLTVLWETADGNHPALDLSDHVTLPYGGVFIDRAPAVVRVPAMRLWYSW
jgi:hypothetical protein